MSDLETLIMAGERQTSEIPLPFSSAMDPNLSEDQFRFMLLNNESIPPEVLIQGIMNAVKKVIDTTDMFPDAGKRLDALIHLTEYLDHSQDEQAKDPTQPFKLCAQYRNLKTFISYNDDISLRSYVKTLYERCMAEENQSRFEKWKAHFSQWFMPDNDDTPDPNLHQRGSYGASEMALNVKDRTVQLMGPTSRWLMKGVLKISPKILRAETVTALDEIFVSMGTQWGQFLSTSVVSLGAVGICGLYNLWCYKNGSRGLERVKKSMIDNSSAIVVGNLAGLGANAALTFLFGPLGFWLSLGIQAVVGFAVGKTTRHYVSKWTDSYYNLPKSEALEDAYRTLKMTKGNTDNEISKQCRELSRKYHPDNMQRREPPPSEKEIKEAVEEFIKIHNAYNFIKTMRQAEKAGVDHNENLDWKENFMLFVRNLFSIRRKNLANEEELTKAIDFQTDGFPPEEVFEELPRDRDFHDIDAPLPTVGPHMNQETVVNRWWNYFWTAMKNTAN